MQIPATRCSQSDQGRAGNVRQCGGKERVPGQGLRDLTQEATCFQVLDPLSVSANRGPQDSGAALPWKGCKEASFSQAAETGLQEEHVKLRRA